MRRLQTVPGVRSRSAWNERSFHALRGRTEGTVFNRGHRCHRRRWGWCPSSTAVGAGRSLCASRSAHLRGPVASTQLVGAWSAFGAAIRSAHPRGPVESMGDPAQRPHARDATRRPGGAGEQDGAHRLGGGARAHVCSATRAACSAMQRLHVLLLHRLAPLAKRQCSEALRCRPTRRWRTVAAAAITC